MKTLTIKDETYNKLLKLKGEGQSFSDVIEALIERSRVSIKPFAGLLRDSEVLEELSREWKSFRERARLRR